jgi:hypothetical protein
MNSPIFQILPDCDKRLSSHVKAATIAMVRLQVAGQHVVLQAELPVLRLDSSGACMPIGDPWDPPASAQMMKRIGLHPLPRKCSPSPCEAL